MSTAIRDYEDAVQQLTAAKNTPEYAGILAESDVFWQSLSEAERLEVESVRGPHPVFPCNP